ncbi:MAG: DUF2975 domain-containing protein [Gemmatimonadetes bacterium]|nr:DUF2975 domain-containing protein [Gemmatimonadota bacterium]
MPYSDKLAQILEADVDVNVAGGRATRIAKVLIDIVWWFVLIGNVAVAAFLIGGPVLMKTRDVAPVLSAEVSLAHGAVLEALPLESPDTITAVHPLLDHGGATLEFHTRRPGLQFFTTLLAVPGALALLLGVGLLRAMLRDVRSGAVFTAENARRVSWIGWLLVVMGFLAPFLDNIRTAIILHAADLTGIALGTADRHGRWNLVLPGLLVLVLAAAWRLGVELQQDRDLTV